MSGLQQLGSMLIKSGMEEIDYYTGGKERIEEQRKADLEAKLEFERRLKAEGLGGYGKKSKKGPSAAAVKREQGILIKTFLDQNPGFAATIDPEDLKLDQLPATAQSAINEHLKRFEAGESPSYEEVFKAAAGPAPASGGTKPPTAEEVLKTKSAPGGEPGSFLENLGSAIGTGIDAVRGQTAQKVIPGAVDLMSRGMDEAGKGIDALVDKVSRSDTMATLAPAGQKLGGALADRAAAQTQQAQPYMRPDGYTLPLQQEQVSPENFEGPPAYQPMDKKGLLLVTKIHVATPQEKEALIRQFIETYGPEEAAKQGIKV